MQAFEVWVEAAEGLWPFYAFFKAFNWGLGIQLGGLVSQQGKSALQFCGDDGGSGWRRRLSFVGLVV